MGFGVNPDSTIKWRGRTPTGQAELAKSNTGGSSSVTSSGGASTTSGGSSSGRTGGSSSGSSSGRTGGSSSGGINVDISQRAELAATQAGQRASFNEAVSRGQTEQEAFKSVGGSVYSPAPTKYEAPPIETIDYDALNKYLAEKGYVKADEVKPPEPYKPAYSTEQVQQLMKTIEGKQFEYDPATDPLLKKSQEQAMSEAAKAMARRGMMYSKGAKTAIAESALQQAPIYEQRAYDRFRGELSDLYGQLQAIQGIEKTGYDRYLDERKRVEEQRATTAKAQETQYKQREEQEIRDYGVPLSPIMREYQNIYSQMTQQDLQRLMPYQQNFAAVISELKTVDPTNPNIPMLEALRAMKILSDPVLLNQYGGEYGMQTGAIRQQAYDIEQSQAKDILDLMKAEAVTLQEQMELEKIGAQIEEIESSIGYKDAQTINEQLKAVAQNIENSFIADEKKAQLNNIANQMYNRNRMSSVAETREARAAEEFGVETGLKERELDIKEAGKDQTARQVITDANAFASDIESRYAIGIKGNEKIPEDSYPAIINEITGLLSSGEITQEVAEKIADKLKLPTTIK